MSSLRVNEDVMVANAAGNPVAKAITNSWKFSYPIKRMNAKSAKLRNVYVGS